ncbi:MAG: NUDIX domain-containing protein [Campylobacterales bacterium]|nr:NUDIX domain-containing protein [Campylobacterales bacterium]
MIKKSAYGICLYKIEEKDLKILLCKSTKSKKKWGFVKGTTIEGETKVQTATREFYEESSIKINPKYLEEYFEQENETKDVGIFLVNFDRIGHCGKYFKNEKLLSKYLSWENSHIMFYSIKSLPLIKNNQKIICQKIIDHFSKGYSYDFGITQTTN